MGIFDDEAAALKLKDENDMLRDLCKRAFEAIMWMSGSPSFTPEGEAHEGWLKTRPMLDELDKVIKNDE